MMIMFSLRRSKENSDANSNSLASLVQQQQQQGPNSSSNSRRRKPSSSQPVFSLDIKTQNTRLVTARQRREIYALNRVMTRLENQRFAQFCSEKGLKGDGGGLVLGDKGGGGSGEDKKEGQVAGQSGSVEKGYDIFL